MEFKERFDTILMYKGRKVYDTLHSFSRFFERGLQHLRPKTYKEIVQRFHLDTNLSERNKSFESALEQIKQEYPDQYKNYWNLYVHLLKKAVDKIIAEGDRIDQYIIVSKKFGLGIQMEWRTDRDGMSRPQGYTATSLGPDTMKWAKGDKKLFVEQLRKDHQNGKTHFKEMREDEIVHRFTWPEDLDDVMFPACIFLEDSRIFRSFQFVDV